MRQQRTIAKRAQVDGFGYWSGQDVRLEFRPAAVDTGLVFVREDLGPAARIPVAVVRRVEVPRRTNLTESGASVEMIEHVLAACMGLQIDNCEIWTNRPEMPGCDGSSQRFVEALAGAGMIEQAAHRSQLVVADVTRVGNDHGWVEARPAPRGRLSIEYCLDYGPGPIGLQHFSLEVTPASFQRELASARTFLTQPEATWLRERGLGQRVSYQDLLVFDEQGPQENALRFPDECVRHKTLDLLGDLAFAARDVAGHVVAYRSGHRLNAELVRTLLEAAQISGDRRRTA